jgi:hypothetical protein
VSDCTVKIIKAEPTFVTKFWDKFVPYLEVLIEREEGVKPTMRRLNNVLMGINTRALDFWVGVRFNGAEREMLGFFITSKCVGGPSGGDTLWVSYLCGMSDIPEEAWVDGIEELKKWAVMNGCSTIEATTNIQRVVDMCVRNGAEQTSRLRWSVQNG